MHRPTFLSRIILAGTCLLLAGLAVGCMRHTSGEKFYLIASNLRLPYWKTVDAGFEKAAKDYGVTAVLRGPDGFNPQQERDEFRQAVAARPAGILIQVVDVPMMKPEIDDAIAAGVPVLTVDSDANTSARLFFIGTNNLAAGRLGAQRLVDKLNGKGNVVFFSMPGQPNLDERLKGYLDVFNEHSGMKVIDVYNIQAGSGSAADKAREYLARTGADKIDAFVCLESASGADVAALLKSANAADRVLIAMDVNPDTLNLIKSGAIEATVAQKPYTMGYVGLKMLDEVHHNPPAHFLNDYQVDSFSPYPVFVDTGTALVDKDNVDLYLRQRASAESQ